VSYTTTRIDWATSPSGTSHAFRVWGLAAFHMGLRRSVCGVVVDLDGAPPVPGVRCARCDVATRCDECGERSPGCRCDSCSDCGGVPVEHCYIFDDGPLCGDCLEAQQEHHA